LPHRLLLPLLLATPWVAFTAPGLALAEAFSARVVGVADGDTITVLRDKTRLKIRLQGVDAPEKAQAFGKRAKQFTSGLVFGKEVRIEPVKQDVFGRTVARVIIDNKSLGEELLRAGMAWHFKRYDKQKKLSLLEQQARGLRRGLWADPNPSPPWDWRRSRRGKGHGPKGRSASARPKLPRSKERNCAGHKDCVFLPLSPCSCPPCGEVWRRSVNRAALKKQILGWAGRRCAVRRCRACEVRFRGSRTACVHGQCVVK